MNTQREKLLFMLQIPYVLKLYAKLELYMDDKDRQIIRALQRNGRMTNQDLAAEVSLSPSPCLRRLKNLEASGAIRGYSVSVVASA